MGNTMCCTFSEAMEANDDLGPIFKKYPSVASLQTTADDYSLCENERNIVDGNFTYNVNNVNKKRIYTSTTIDLKNSKEKLCEQNTVNGSSTNKLNNFKIEKKKLNNFSLGASNRGFKQQYEKNTTNSEITDSTNNSSFEEISVLSKEDLKNWSKKLCNGISISVLFPEGNKIDCKIKVDCNAKHLVILFDNKIRQIQFSDILTLLYGGNCSNVQHEYTNLLNDPQVVGIKLQSSGKAIAFKFLSKNEAKYFMSFIDSIL